MPHATLTIDGTTVLDTQLDTGGHHTPTQIAELIQTARTSKQPWLKVAMIPLAEAILLGHDITITITTDSDGWTLDVDHPTLPPNSLAPNT